MIKNMNKLILTSLLIVANTSLANGTMAQTYSYSYTSGGLISSIDGPRTDVSDVISYEYYPNGDISKIRNGLGHIAQYFDYNIFGNPGRIIDSNGIETLLSYDSAGRIISHKVVDPNNSPDGIQIQYEYDGLGRLIQVALAHGDVITYHYDDFSRVTSLTSSSGERIEYTWSAAGQPENETRLDVNSNIRYQINYSYNQLRQLQAIVRGGGQEKKYKYNWSGNETTSTDERNFVTSKLYDTLNRLISVIDPLQGQTHITHNEIGEVASVTDPRGNTTSFTYDIFGNLTGTHSPDSGTTEFSYDYAGNRTKKIDSRGITAEYKFDPLNRMTEIRYPESQEDNVQYFYDSTSEGNYGIGKLTRIEFSGGHIELIYNYLGLVEKKRSSFEGREWVIEYKYDTAGQIAEVTYPSGRVVRYERDQKGRPLNIFTRASAASQEELVLAGAVYVPLGDTEYFNYGNGLARTLEYDQSYRVTRLKVNGDSPILDWSYQYDLADNITNITNNLNAQKTQSFEYDELNRLVRAEGIYGRIDYSYDEVGNRLTQHTLSEGTQYQDIYFNDTNSNQLSHVDSYINNVPSQTREFSYDESGNRLEGIDEIGREIDYEYDTTGRLRKIFIADQTLAEYWYNPLGQRIKKSLGNDQIEIYQYDELGRLIAVDDGDNGTLREYIYRDNEQVAIVTQAKTVPPSLAPNSFIQTQPIILEATTAFFSGGHAISTDHQNYSGDGFIDFIGEGSASWNVEAPNTGSYLIDIRYAVTGSNRPLDLAVNGNVLHRVSFPSTGSFNSWESAIKLISLNEGTQTLSLNTTGFSGPNVDRVQLLPIQLGTASRFDESNADFIGQHVIANNFSGHDGSGFIDVVGEGEVSWALNIPNDSNYLVRIRYALGAGLRPMNLEINDLHLGKVNFPPTTTFENWSEVLLVASLTSGPKALKLETLGASGPNIDFLELIEIQTSGVSPPPPNTSESSLYFIHNDHLGTPQFVTDNNKLIVWAMDYKPFGEAVEEPNDGLELPTRFPGQHYDAESGLHYNYFRDYDPSLGRYLQSDPIGLSGGLNTYIYANANPLIYTDPEGLTPAHVVGGAGSGVGALVGLTIGAGAIYCSFNRDHPSCIAAQDLIERCLDSLEDEPCPPCTTVSGRIVPVGTIGYRTLEVIPDDVMQHGVYGSHHNIFIAKQAPRGTPKPCKCQWVKQKYVLKPEQLTPGMVPVEEFIYVE